MLLPESNISCESSQILQEYCFGIHDTGLIFEILRTKIYKDPIAAIVREISCNARDAHRELAMEKNDPSIAEIPIEITLPNGLSPYIKFKDYGPGISPDRMENVFCQYAASTKRNDNIQTGGFGLGCKTPFSYSDSFGIVTVIDGVKRVYSAVIDETRVGKVLLNSKSDTDEPNGTTIIIAVKRDDFNKFNEAVIRTTQYWDVRPKLSGMSPLPEYQDEEKILDGNGWYIGKGKSDAYGYYTNKSPLALIDGIQYALDIDSLYEYSDRYGANADKAHTLLEVGTRINFHIGELTLSASRDNIHFDDKTKKIIKDRVKEIFNEIISTLEQRIASCKTYPEACCLAYQVRNELPNSIRSACNEDNITWNKNKIRFSLDSNAIGKDANIIDYEQRNFTRTGFFTFTYSRSKQGNLNWPISSNTGKAKIFLHDYSDQVPGTTPRISRLLIQHIFDTNPTLKSIQILCIPPEAINTSDYDLLNLLDFDRLSDVTITKEEKDTVRAKVFNSLKKSGPGTEKDPDKANGYTFDWGRRGGVDLCTPVKSYDIDADGVYVVLDTESDGSGKIITTNGYTLGSSLHRNIVKFLSSGCSDQTTIIAFSPQNVKKLGDGWLPLYDVAKEKADKIIGGLDQNKLADAMNSSSFLIKSFSLFSSYDYKDFVTTATLLSKTSIKEDDELIQYIKKSEEYSKLQAEVSALSGLFNWLNIKPINTNPASKNQSELEIICKKCMKKYPMLFVLDGYNIRYNSGKLHKGEKELVFDYIDLMAKQDSAS